MPQKQEKEFDSAYFPGRYRVRVSPHYKSSIQGPQSDRPMPSSEDNPPPLAATETSLVFQESLTLSARDRDLVLSTLERPQPLNCTLKSAIRRFRHKYGE